MAGKVSLVPSKYNILLDVDGDRSLICNLRNLHIAWIDNRFQDGAMLAQDFENDEECRRLISHQFIVGSDFDESADFCLQRRAFIENKCPKHMQYVIAPTMRCNCNCWYCFEDKRSAHTMTTEECEAVVHYIESQVSQNDCCEVLHLTWFGGEPTLALEQIALIGGKVNAFCSTMGIRLESAIVSNGILLTQNAVKELVESTNLIRCQISMDGTRERYAKDKGVPPSAYDKVLRNLNSIAELIEVTVRINIHKDNEADAKALYLELLSNEAVAKNAKIYFAPITNCSSCSVEAVYTPREFRKISDELAHMSEGALIQGRYPELRKASCGAMRRTFVCIGPDLNLYRCEHCLGHSELAVGTIQSGYDSGNTFDEAFLGELSDRCIECPYVPICQGGCRVKNVLGIDSPDCSEMDNIVKWQVTNLLDAARRGG